MKSDIELIITESKMLWEDRLNAITQEAIMEQELNEEEYI